ncbi:MAG TPA: polyprenyl synthetase family protein [Streptosporangiaceae bacterium]|jgi:geranylgeranyl diphosphate synthase type I|nr:polyprenyl synthetase family protein [Streptosporangiaceae bacterium]
MTGDDGDLTRIRSEVNEALGRFLARQRSALAAIGPALDPCADAITDFLAGGKRLRAAFCYWGWRACGGPDGPQIFTAAAALELLHASALVHDDLMDGSDTRRGQPAAHKRFAASHASAGWHGSADRFGAGAAILVGDLLLAWTDEMLRTSGLEPEAIWRGLAVLDSMRTEVLAGQYLDLVEQASAASSVNSALLVVTYKSAKYTVERPLRLGAALHGRQPGVPVRPQSGRSGHDGSDLAAVNAAFSGYGIPIGIAFQLRDDVLGVFGDPAKTGKPVLDDLREGKRTVMLAIARERADPLQAAVLDRHVGDPQLDQEAARQVRAVITSTGALAECEAMISVRVKEALAALDNAPITGESRSALADLAIAATERTD